MLLVYGVNLMTDEEYTDNRNGYKHSHKHAKNRHHTYQIYRSEPYYKLAAWSFGILSMILAILFIASLITNSFSGGLMTELS